VSDEATIQVAVNKDQPMALVAIQVELNAGEADIEHTNVLAWGQLEALATPDTGSMGRRLAFYMIEDPALPRPDTLSGGSPGEIRARLQCPPAKGTCLRSFYGVIENRHARSVEVELYLNSSITYDDANEAPDDAFIKMDVTEIEDFSHVQARTRAIPPPRLAHPHSTIHEATLKIDVQEPLNAEGAVGFVSVWTKRADSVGVDVYQAETAGGFGGGRDVYDQITMETSACAAGLACRLEYFLGIVEPPQGTRWWVESHLFYPEQAGMHGTEMSIEVGPFEDPL
jgi:hypothetical protein